MADLLALILPIFMMIGVGAAFVRFGLFPAEGLAVLNRFMMTACIPVLMFSAVTNGDGLADFAYGKAALYAIASLTSVLVLMLVLRFVLRQPLPQSLILALAAGASNSVFLGYPIASAVIPERAAQVFSWVVLAETLFIIPVVTSLALWAEHRGEGLSLGRTFLPLARSPVTIGLAAGFAFLASGFALAAPIEAVVRSIIQAAPFIALFLIGGMLVQVRITRAGPRVAALTAAKLVVHPLLVAAGFTLVFGWPAEATQDAVLFASVPVFATFVVFCARHQVGEVAASAVVISTLIGTFTLTAILSALNLP